jgi:hypothetical protein
VIAGSFAESFVRRIGEYLGASDARLHLWHACLASEHPHFQVRSVSPVSGCIGTSKGLAPRTWWRKRFGCAVLLIQSDGVNISVYRGAAWKSDVKRVTS